ncbi:ComEC/Rec2 family competence protein [Corynebacterium sp. Q4381]|uniref:ComEC/Rec2 family competence protein n=1 Tax=Corynebacterium sp. Marseille-Q4381 TaxID=3121597 RepID=UPI002FE54C1F
MSELRLVPAALTVWLASILCVTVGTWAGLALVAAAGLICLVCGHPGQSLLAVGLGCASCAVASVRVRVAQNWEFGERITGRVTSAPKLTSGGSWLTRISPDGHPSTLAVFSTQLPDGVEPGATVVATGALKASRVAAVNPYVFNGEVEMVQPPTGYAAFAAHVRRTFAESVDATVGPSSRGLIPGMVLGDTSAQTAAEEQAYIATGLSHLSAVSGSNVTYVTTAAVVAATLIGCGLRTRLACAAAALLLFAGLVGPEPSVLRASVTGLVGLVAVIASTRAEPVHALCIAVIALVLADTDLAVHYGFALSVAATAGIVTLHPLLYRWLAPTGWPDILVRAVAVAIAADVVTMPIVSLMAGEVSLVSAAANVLVAPVTGAVTVLGLLAAVLCLLPGGLEVPLLIAIEPLTWWVHAVATNGARLPFAKVEAGPVMVLVAYGWVIAGLMARRPRITFAITAGVIGALHLQPLPAPVVDQTALRAHVVATRSEIEPVPPGTELVVVLEPGAPTKRPTKTPAGIPVIFPNRDGAITLRADGSRSPP